MTRNPWAMFWANSVVVGGVLVNIVLKGRRKVGGKGHKQMLISSSGLLGDMRATGLLCLWSGPVHTQRSDTVWKWLQMFAD